MNWQPIETAPKDGTSILLGCNYERMGKQRVTRAWWERGMWAEAMYWSEDDQEFLISQCAFRASHWMPLPTPPNVQSLDAGSQPDQA